jgi:hypothetical protein
LAERRQHLDYSGIAAHRVKEGRPRQPALGCAHDNNVPGLIVKLQEVGISIYSLRSVPGTGGIEGPAPAATIIFFVLKLALALNGYSMGIKDGSTPVEHKLEFELLLALMKHEIENVLASDMIITQQWQDFDLSVFTGKPRPVFFLAQILALSSSTAISYR